MRNDSSYSVLRLSIHANYYMPNVWEVLKVSRSGLSTTLFHGKSCILFSWPTILFFSGLFWLSLSQTFMPKYLIYWKSVKDWIEEFTMSYVKISIGKSIHSLIIAQIDLKLWRNLMICGYKEYSCMDERKYKDTALKVIKTKK